MELDPEKSIELIERAQAGDASALDRLLARYRPRLQRWASGRLPRYARQMTDTDDLVQEVLIGTIKNFHRFQHRGEWALQAYLRQAVTNRIRDELRRFQAQPRHLEVPESLPAHEASPLEAAVGRQIFDRYEASLALLGEAEREAVIGRLELGCSYEELAFLLEKPSADAARMVVARALAKVAQAIDAPIGQRAPGSLGFQADVEYHPPHGTCPMSPDASVLSLAEAVADGAAVDWDHAESSASPDERQIIVQLRQLASLRLVAKTEAGTWGPFQIRGEIGSGSFGTVYRAWDTKLEREVALKLLRADPDSGTLASAILSEGKLLAQIRHPNVVTVYGADTYDGRTGVWMELVAGRTLKDLVAHQGRFGAIEAALIGRDLCRAVAAVHEKGFLHSDIKAQNVMREAGGRIVLMDFGAGGAVDADRRGVLAGTPAYLAPEVLAGAKASVRSDLYSLGVLLYHLVSGQFPVTGGSLEQLRQHHSTGKRLLLRDARPDLPTTFVHAVDRAIAADAVDRPESAGTLERSAGAPLTSPDNVLRTLSMSGRLFPAWRSSRRARRVLGAVARRRGSAATG